MVENRVFTSVISIIFIVSIVSGYSFRSEHKDYNREDRNAEETDNAWHKPREGSDTDLETKSSDDEEEWPGRWMPARPDEPPLPPKILHQTGEFKLPTVESRAESSPVSMGVRGGCDNGKTNLRVDWDLSPVNYTCYDKKIVPNYSTDPIIYCEHIPWSYSAIHLCMDRRISYDDDIPLYGTHRPVWPTYGEYKFIPRQRWIHSLEHGGIVMLYHPCANPLEVKRLKKLVQGCLRRHIITPHTLLDEERPLALVSWGCRLTMSYVNPTVVKEFITKKALRGPEEIARDGNFKEYLIQASKTVTDRHDTTLCPNM